MAGDFRDQAQSAVDAQSQQLIRLAGELLLVGAIDGLDLARTAGVAQQTQQEFDAAGQWCKGLQPLRQIALALLLRQMLPGVIGGQVEFAGAAGNARPAADRHEPFVVLQALAHAAVLLTERLVGLIEFAEHGIERGLGHRRIAAIADEGLPMAFEFLEDFRLEILAACDIHDLEQGDQREMVMLRQGALLQHIGSAEQVFQPEQGAHAFVQGVFVQNHGPIQWGAARAQDPVREILVLSSAGVAAADRIVLQAATELNFCAQVANTAHAASRPDRSGSADRRCCRSHRQPPPDAAPAWPVPQEWR